MSSIEKLGGLEQRLTVIVPAEDVDKAYKICLQKAVRTVKLPKFRPGKAPSAIIEKFCSKFILQEVGSELIRSSLLKVIKEHQLRVVGTPKIKMTPVLRGQSFHYEVNLEVLPEITFQSLTGEVIVRPKVEVSEEDINKMIKALYKQHAEWKEVDGAAQVGDKVVIDFEHTLDGKPIDHSSFKGFQLELGSKRMVAGFEESIEGMKVGESKTLNVTFPSDYPSEELAGKPTVFNITLHKVMMLKFLPFDDRFAKRLGIKEDSVEVFRQKVRIYMEKEVQCFSENKLKMIVLDKLIERNPIEIPESLVEKEINRLKQAIHQKIAIMQTHKLERAKKIELTRGPYREQAIKRVTLSLLLAEVIKKYKIRVDSNQVRSLVEKVAASCQDPEKTITWYYSNKKILSEIELIVLENQAVTKLLSELEVKDQVITYEEAAQQIYSNKVNYECFNPYCG